MNLLTTLQEEKSSGLKGAIYHQTHIKLTYNTNRIEGSKLSEQQTRYIYETNTFFSKNNETATNIDDIIESINHFSCFDYILYIVDESISEQHIKRFHSLLKNNTSDSKKSWFRVGEYKLRPNIVGGIETSLPSDVLFDMKNLISKQQLVNKI